MSEPFVRSDVRSFLNFVESVPAPKMHELEPAAARQQYVGMRDLADLPIGELAVTKDLTIPGPAGDIPARLFDAKSDRAPGPAVAFFHGGGFVIGNIDTHAPACAEMARILDLPVISIDYRLAPEHPWPAAPDDCEAAARWVAGNPQALGRSVTSLVLAGDSAGGTLTIVTAMTLRDTPADVPVIAQFPIYPAADTAHEYPSFDAFGDGYLLTKESMRWFDRAYRADYTDPRGAPMQGDLSNLPPALIITAGLDPLRDQGRAYAAALIQHGIATTYREAVGNIHGFITIRKAIPSSQGDYAGALTALKAVVTEAEANRVMAQAAQ